MSQGSSNLEWKRKSGDRKPSGDRRQKQPSLTPAKALLIYRHPQENLPARQHLPGGLGNPWQRGAGPGQGHSCDRFRKEDRAGTQPLPLQSLARPMAQRGRAPGLTVTREDRWGGAGQMPSQCCPAVPEVPRPPPDRAPQGRGGATCSSTWSQTDSSAGWVGVKTRK